MTATDLTSVGGLLGLSAIVTVVYQLFFFFIAYGLQFDKVTDLAGGSNFVILASITYGLGAAQLGPSQQQMAITALVIVWGVRLSGFLLYRILVINEDHRFDGIRDSFFKFLFFWVFQMLWVWVVSLPVTFVNSLPTVSPNGTLVAGDYAGIVLAAIGLCIETAADQTKFDFKQVRVAFPSGGTRTCTTLTLRFLPLG
jgi:steroid 5-alpha reductase family enzyme